MRVAVEIDEDEFIDKLRQWHDPQRLATVNWQGHKQIIEPYTYFWLGEQEVFGRKRTEEGWRGGWGDAIPPVVFAWFGLAAVQRAWIEGAAELPLDEEGDHITFERQAGGMAVRGTWLRLISTVPHEPLLRAWQAYNERIRTIMREHDPSFLCLKRYGQYGSGRLPHDYLDWTDEYADWDFWMRWLNGQNPSWQDGFASRDRPRQSS